MARFMRRFSRDGTPRRHSYRSQIGLGVHGAIQWYEEFLLARSIWLAPRKPLARYRLGKQTQLAAK